MKSSVDLLLVIPCTRPRAYQELANDLAAIEPPVWGTLIATFIRNRGYGVRILDAEALGQAHAQTAKEILASRAVLTVFIVYGQQPSASTQCMPAGRAVCQIVKEGDPLLPTIVMGTHASALPERTLREEPYQFVCQGEGPYTILRLLEQLQTRHPNWETVPGLWYWKDGKPNATGSSQNIQDLDRELPSQAWDLLDMTKYRAHNWHCFDHLDARQPYGSIQTSLGCPYKCSFCCINAPFGGPGAGIRYFTPNHFIQQVDLLVRKYGVTNIKIPDEMFVLNERHVLGICDLIIERGYKLNIWAYARVDTVREKFLEKLKKAGFNWLGIGVESASKHVRDGVEKGKFNAEDIDKVIKRIRDQGIYVGANYIFGLPDDTLKTMRETLDLAMGLNTEWANFYSAMAYPGSPLYQVALQKGWPLPEDWIGYSQHAYETLPLLTETISGPEVLAFRDQAFLEYFNNPSYLALIEMKFGKNGVDHIHYMTQRRLKRKYVDPSGRPIPLAA